MFFFIKAGVMEPLRATETLRTAQLKINSPAIGPFSPFFLGNGADLRKQDKMIDAMREGKYKLGQVRSRCPLPPEAGTHMLQIKSHSSYPQDVPP